MEQNKKDISPQEVVVTVMEYKGIPGQLHQREVKDSVIDAQVERLAKQFGCANVQDLVRMVSGYGSLEEMKAELRQAKMWQYAQIEQVALQDRLLNEAAMRMELELPVPQLQRRADVAYQAEVNACIDRYTNITDHLAALGKTLLSFRKELLAKEDLEFRKAVLIYQVAQKENIVISAQDIEDEYHSIAASRGVEVKDVMRGLTEQSVAYSLTVRKVRTLLVEHAILTHC